MQLAQAQQLVSNAQQAAQREGFHISVAVVDQAGLQVLCPYG